MTTSRKYSGALAASLLALACAAPALAQSSQPYAPAQGMTSAPTTAQTQWQQSAPQEANATGGMSYMQQIHEGDMTYITGGIGEDERDTLKAGAQEYNVKIVNADKTGHYTADTNLTIQSKDGREMLSANNTGPLFYAKLPPGEYTVQATNGDQHRMQKINVSASKSKDLEFVWHDRDEQRL